MTDLFERYFPYLRQFQSGHYPQAVDEGLAFLSEIKRFSPDQYQTAHKGTPFYMVGIAAYLSHDFQTAAFLFDAAADEDLKNHPTKPETPALLFMQLNIKNLEQAAHPLVIKLSEKLEAATKDYNARTGSAPITANDVRKHFLAHIISKNEAHLRSLITSFVSFLAEWDYRSSQIELSESASREPFFTHLFRGCLLFESILKENPLRRPTGTTLGNVLKNDLFTELKISPNISISSQSFDAIVQSLTAQQDIETAIQSTGKTRNTLGHSVVWTSDSLSAHNYNLLAHNISASCLHAISTLYR